MCAPHDYALQMQNELNSTSNLMIEFKRKVGLSLHSPAWNVWAFIHREQSDAGLEPELIDLDNLTQTGCETHLLWLERMGCLKRENELVRTDRFLSEHFAEVLR